MLPALRTERKSIGQRPPADRAPAKPTSWLRRRDSLSAPLRLTSHELLRRLAKPSRHAAAHSRLEDNAPMLQESHWLASLDPLRLECDGMTRVISALLQRDGIAYTPMMGSLDVETAGRIAPHCWVELEDGRRIDLRARMWLGDKPGVSHGIVPAHAVDVRYEGATFQVVVNPIVFWALTDTTMDDFGSADFLASSAPVAHAGTHSDSRSLRPPERDPCSNVD